MRIFASRHIGWFLLPTVQWQSAMVMFGMHVPWQVTVWFGSRGITFEGPSSRGGD